MSNLLQILINKYQAVISPILKRKGYQCLFKPTCSQYSLTCLKKHHLLKALLLIIYRLLSCNPINAYLKHNRKELIYGKAI